MNYKIHAVPAILITCYMFPNIFWLAVLAMLLGAACFIGYVRMKFWYILAKKIVEYKD